MASRSQTTWRNPYGYLPGELYYFMPFFGMMTLAYLGLGLVWGVQCWRHWNQLLPLQMCIAGVVLLGLLEASTWYLDYASFNRGGSRDISCAVHRRYPRSAPPPPTQCTAVPAHRTRSSHTLACPSAAHPSVAVRRRPVVIAVSISTVRKTVSRLLVLAVCLGYGVVRPTLGNLAYKVLGLGLCYTIFSAALDVTSNVSQISELSVPVRLLFIAPVACLDALFYWWTFSGLTRTLSQLSTRRQSAKLLLYRQLG